MSQGVNSGASRVILTSHALGWRDIALEQSWLGPASKPVKVLPSHFLGVALGGPCELEWRVSGRWERRRLLPGQAWLMPSGVDASIAWSSSHATIRYALSPGLVDRVAMELGGRARELNPCTAMTAPDVARVLRSLHVEAVSPGGATALLADALACELSIHLLRAQVDPAPGRATRLSSAGLRRTCEYVEEHLGEGIELAALASIAGLSVCHFARAFKASTGVAPHRYLRERRLERAKLLLGQSEQSVLSIARAVGFESASHFAKIFARAVGMSPSAWRRALK